MEVKHEYSLHLFFRSILWCIVYVGAMNTYEKYDLEYNQWSFTRRMNLARWLHQIGVIDKKFCSYGGKNTYFFDHAQRGLTFLMLWEQIVTTLRATRGL